MLILTSHLHLLSLGFMPGTVLLKKKKGRKKILF